MIVTYTVMTFQAFHTKCVQDFTTLRALTINQPLQVHFKSDLQVKQKKMLSSLLTGQTGSQCCWGTGQKWVSWFSHVTFAGTQNSPCRGRTPWPWPWLGWARLEHQGRIPLPELEHTIAVALPRSPLPTAALILPKCDSAWSPLIAKRLILQQSPNLTCWVEEMSFAPGEFLRLWRGLSKTLLYFRNQTLGNKFFYLLAKSAPLSSVFPCFNLSCHWHCLNSNQCSLFDLCNGVSDYRPNNRFYWQTLKTHFCSEVAVQIALQHFMFIFC